MPAQDSIHDAVVRAIQKDGWAVRDDPLTIEFGELYLFIDLGAERTVIAERGVERIAVEIKSFPSKSKVADLQQAVGQYAVYRAFLREVEPERALYLAVSTETHDRVFARPTGELVRADVGIFLVVIDVGAEEVVSWIT
jgi:hypothetical protein